jgi:hypothetical protein
MVNPITRMMKLYIKTPLKYALPLLFIGSLALVSISGCTSSTSSPTATPSAAPTATASFDPVLKKMEPVLKAEYSSPGANITITETPASASQSTDMLTFGVYYPQNGTTIGATITNQGASQAAAQLNSLSASDISNGGVNSPSLVTGFGLQAATVALGHTPSTVNDVYVKGTGNNEGINTEYFLYDSLLILVMTTTTS